MLEDVREDERVERGGADGAAHALTIGEVGADDPVEALLGGGAGLSLFSIPHTSHPSARAAS